MRYGVQVRTYVSEVCAVFLQQLDCLRRRDGFYLCAERCFSDKVGTRAAELGEFGGQLLVFVRRKTDCPEDRFHLVFLPWASTLVARIFLFHRSSVFLLTPKSGGRRSRGPRRILTATPAPVLGCELASGQGVRASLRLAEREPVTDLFVTRKVNLLLTSFGGKDTQRYRHSQMFSEHAGKGGSGRISKSPVVTCPARILADEGERSARPLARGFSCAARVLGHSSRPAVRCRWQLHEVDRTRRGGKTWARNWRGVSVKGEDAGRCRWQLQLCWIDRAS